jgi:hypothetical protein
MSMWSLKINCFLNLPLIVSKYFQDWRYWPTLKHTINVVTMVFCSLWRQHRTRNGQSNICQQLTRVNL